jgi:hypothetical protein
MATNTTNYNLIKPAVNDPTDQDLWGGYLNSDLDIIDSVMKTNEDLAVGGVVDVTSNYTVTSADQNRTLFIDATSGNITISLPSYVDAGEGFEIAFKRVDSSSNTITIDPNSSEEIDGATSKTIDGQYDYLAIKLSDEWGIVGRLSGGAVAGTDFFHVQDRKAAETDGGTSTAGSWQTRVLNSIQTNDIGATLSSNTITLLAGTYYLEAVSPTVNSRRARAAFYNVTDSSFQLLGLCALGDAGGDDATNTVSQIFGQFTIGATKQFQLQYRVESGYADNGLGAACNFSGLEEIYADVRIWKLA